MIDVEISSVQDYKDAVEQIGFAAAAHLRSRGWKHTSATPGCYWMWEIEIGGQRFLVDFSDAMRIQGIREAEEHEANDLVNEDG